MSIPMDNTAFLDPFRDSAKRGGNAASSPLNNSDVPPPDDEMHSMYEDSSFGHRAKPASNCCTALLQRLVPHGGSLSGMVNLASGTLGASIISLPFAFSNTGVAVSVVMLVAITAATVFAIHLLVEAGEKTGLKSYEELARTYIGRNVDKLVAFLMWFFCFGTCTAYVIALGDVFSPFLRGTNGFFGTDWGTHVVVLIVWAVGMVPLTLPKEINSLRYFSLVAVSLILFFVLVMLYNCFRYGLDSDHLDKVQSVEGGTKALGGLSLFMFAFMCQINAFEVYFEMHPRSVARMTSDASVSMSICCLLYVVAGFFGYFNFGSSTQDAVLKNYNPKSDLLIAISFVGIAFKLCVGFSLCIQPARDAVFYALNIGDYQAVPTRKRLAVCLTMAVAALILGLFIPKINIVFGILGSLIGGLVGFAFPAWFSMKTVDNWSLATVGLGKYVATWALLIGGIVSFVVGTVASILDIAGFN